MTINSFTDLWCFLDYLSKMIVYENIKRQIFITQTLIESYCDIKKDRKYKYDISDFEKLAKSSMFYLYSRKALAKVMLWEIKYETTEMIIQKCKLIFNKVDHLINDYKKQVLKY